MAIPCNRPPQDWDCTRPFAHDGPCAAIPTPRPWSFSQALVALKMGDLVARRGWNGKGMYLALQTPDAGSKMSLPYIYMKTADGHLVPWLASQTDLLSDDWIALT